MKTACSCAVLALVACGFAASSSPARGQDLQFYSAYSTNNAWNYQTPTYVVQVLYVTVQPNSGGRGSHYGYSRYYTWITVAESEDLAEATFIYQLYKLAEEQYVLYDVAPKVPNAYPISVSMITEYQTAEAFAW